ncbi:hypothetical protein L6164_013397 [Bauhinia variegata]|uniref:Uncharacterized protein n=1 Tax=Bauhinia variegata TaxID=167791 RepID=A0ACB9NHN0_BAUVA|nr:hypothetical protein L6164_013397 [Bauhinia variegata]
MRGAARRDEVASSSRAATRAGDQLREVKIERASTSRVEASGFESTEDSQQDAAGRRVIRSKYLALMNLMKEKRDDLMSTDSDRFNAIMDEVEKLHEQVQKPREQVADAEALLDLATSLVGSAKALMNDGITPSQFVGCLLNDFGSSSSLGQSSQGAQNSINWKEIGMTVSPIFMEGHGCSTMLGPMENELKQRKTTTRGKRAARPTTKARPEEINDAGTDEKTDTDKNMAKMFEILRLKKRVRLESLILNRKSFAQTVENLFALSFLVKDGRVHISVDESGSHFVVPKNAPAANLVLSKEVSYSHFMFRYDYQDWKLMKDVVPQGEELMPDRIHYGTVVDSQAEIGTFTSQPVLVATPIRKLSRNRGLILQEEGLVEETPECDGEAASKTLGLNVDGPLKEVDLIANNMITDKGASLDKLMYNKLKAVWGIQGGMELVDLGHGCFLDVMFKPSGHEIETIKPWVRFLELNMLHYSELLLMTIAKEIGTPEVENDMGQKQKVQLVKYK